MPDAASPDPVVLLDNTTDGADRMTVTNPSYARPIYILVDGFTMSSSEMFVGRMRRHPMVKLVGSNTRGGEAYGDVMYMYLPASNICFGFGGVYREMSDPDFELKGFTPDIRVPDGQDAMAAALRDLAAQYETAHANARPYSR